MKVSSYSEYNREYNTKVHTVMYIPVIMEQHVEEDIERISGVGGLEDPGKPGRREGGGLNLHQDLGHREAVTEVSCGARLDNHVNIVRRSL